MTDTPRTGPPEKRERRPGQEAATLGKAGKVNNRDNATNGAALSPVIGAPQRPPSMIGPRDWGELCDCGKCLGIPVRPSLWGLSYFKDEPAWIVVQLGAADLPDWLLAGGVRRASHLIVASDVDEFCPIAAELAARGGRVLFIDRPIGAPFPGGGG